MENYITWTRGFDAASIQKKAKLEFGFITMQDIFNIRGTKIYDVYMGRRLDILKQCLARHIRKITVYRVQALQEDTPQFNIFTLAFIFSDSI